uniref:Uncharacterized protein n=1 Tax=Megaselia scalaris TaxID=36166 RepID=T1H2Q5_MEGSC
VLIEIEKRESSEIPKNVETISTSKKRKKVSTRMSESDCIRAMQRKSRCGIVSSSPAANSYFRGGGENVSRDIGAILLMEERVRNANVMDKELYVIRIQENVSVVQKD